ncbi:DNA double-strand break repair nuclease NurA [Leptothoe spongobia]|uniref:DNA double-strand break repair nuclease NurA n=1 Tax=Leptothoe spongobia TAU-MAC 1115 TaxID=1967444 RepID=A0A947GGN3_9CYAN|nr:DNA double-strand break repair nuclease NurA [Leptothoe spongobia]MBT9314980.1 DNA double-strand break repair nuclease NurA [Leptothoe spongobia TAU-MAC 1115]
MAIKPSQIQAILQKKRKDFRSFESSNQSGLEAYQAAWQDLCSTQPEQLQDWLTTHQRGNVGARPLEPLSKPGVCRSNLRWSNREHSLQWVSEHLSGVTTFAVDGSQIFSSKDLSLPIALVQVGWFENPHTPDGAYTKDIELNILTPRDLRVHDPSTHAERIVNLHRFQMETERLVSYIEQVKDPEHCLVFFDGSLVATFADAYEEDARKAYVKALLKLLRASEHHRVPLVGYVDTSYAHDLTTLLELFIGVEKMLAVHDAQMLSRFMEWGDCTPIFRCDRTGILADYKEQSDRITFTYLKTNQGPPARIEMPRWMHETALTDQILNWVRAETIVGGGYPYAIETADQTAVLQTSDRQIFFRILQDWASHEQLQLRWSRKMMSKIRRR